MFFTRETNENSVVRRDASPRHFIARREDIIDAAAVINDLFHLSVKGIAGTFAFPNRARRVFRDVLELFRLFFPVFLLCISCMKSVFFLPGCVSKSCSIRRLFLFF